MKSEGQLLMTAFLSLLLLIAGSATKGFAQQGALPAQAPPPAERPAALAARTDRRITLDVVVTDRSGNPVPGLQQQDFTLLDDKQPQTIVSFHAADGTNKAADPPMQASLLVDAVNTSYQNVSIQRLQLEKFLRHDGGELPLPTCLFNLTDKSANHTEATRDGNILADSLNSQASGLRTITRAQGYYGGVESRQISLNALERLAAYEATQPGRKTAHLARSRMAPAHRTGCGTKHARSRLALPNRCQAVRGTARGSHHALQRRSSRNERFARRRVLL